MKKCLVIVACLAFVLLAGCNRCGMWDWYDPCDLVEGRAERECAPCRVVYQSPCRDDCSPCGAVRTVIAVPAEASTEPLPGPDELAPVMLEEEAVIEVIEEAPAP